MTNVEAAAAHLIDVLATQDRPAVTSAAVALMDATAAATELHAEHDDALVELADRLAEKAALWAYFDRPGDFLALSNALRGYQMAAMAIAADELPAR